MNNKIKIELTLAILLASCRADENSCKEDLEFATKIIAAKDSLCEERIQVHKELAFTNGQIAGIKWERNKWEAAIKSK